MTPRQVCRRYADDLSGFVDQRLGQRRLMQVSEHLIRCPECRAHVEDLRAVRQRLSSCCSSSADLSASLAARLQGIAGEERDEPLYLSAANARTRRRSPLIAGVFITSLTVVGLLVLCLALAREPLVVAQPVTDAREQYLMSMATINAHSGVGAVMWARERGTVAGPAVRLTPREVPTSDTTSIAESQALDLLSGAQDPSYSGTQRVWLLDSNQQFRANEVEINHVTGEGTSLTVLDADKQSSLTWFAPELGCCATAVDTAWSFSRYEDSAVVAGRTSIVVEASLGDDVVARWWVDHDTGVLLWAERYTADGVLSEVAGFTNIRYGNTQLATNSVGVATLETVVAVNSSDWCIGLQACPLNLAGLPLVALSNSANQQLLVYSDGMRMLSLTWTSGRLAETSRVEDFAAGQPLVAAWQVDNGVLTVTTSSSLTLLDQACAELPEESPYRYGVFERIASGLGRLVGSS